YQALVSSKEPYSHVLVMKYLSYDVFITGPYFRIILAYVYINYAINLSFSNSLSQMLSKPLITICKIRKVKHLVKTHRELRERINSTMGFIPLISLSLTLSFTLLMLLL